MRNNSITAGLGFRVSVMGFLLIWLAGCGASALVNGAATATGQAMKTTSKATGTAARATIGGAQALGRMATKPFRKDPPVDQGN